MAGYGLTTNNDATYADSTLDPGVKKHQQDHDKIHAHVNLFDKDLARNDGDVLTWDASTNLWVPEVPTPGSGGSQTTFSTAAPGTVFRLVWNGTAWPSNRPSGRTDIFFDLVGAPDNAAAPTWKLASDLLMPAGTPLSVTQVTAIAQARVDAYASVDTSGGGGTSDHGSLAGLADDDHPQYLNVARGDARYYTQALVNSAINTAIAASSTDDRNRANHTGTQGQSSVTNLTTDLAAKAPLNNPVFTGTVTVPDGSLAIADVSGLSTQLAFLANFPTLTKTANYTFVLSDAGYCIESNLSTALTFTVPTNATVAYPLGTMIGLSRYGAGSLTIAGASGVTVRTSSSLTLRAQYSGASLRKRGADEWILEGDLT